MMNQTTSREPTTTLSLYTTNFTFTRRELNVGLRHEKPTLYHLACNSSNNVYHCSYNRCLDIRSLLFSRDIRIA